MAAELARIADGGAEAVIEAAAAAVRKDPALRELAAPVSGLLEHQARKVARRLRRRLAIADALTGKARTVARADAATRLLALARHGCAAAVPAKTTPPKEAANGNG